MRRFDTLDGLRGLGACMIAAAHASLFVRSSLQDHRMIDGLYLLVDFFFVLSGFVIAAGFQKRLETGEGLVPFLIMRLGRLYPLHLSMLLLLLGLKVGLKLAGLDANAVMRMGGPGEYSATSLFTNFFLVQALGVENGLTWNWPSWSISVELFTYVVFAALWATLGVFKNGDRALTAIYLGLLVACPLLLAAFAPGRMNSTYDFAIVRCLLGFTVGVLTYRLYVRLGEDAGSRAPFLAATVVEIAAVAACVGLVWLADVAHWIVLAPLALGVFVLLFAYERGAVSRLLRAKPLLFLGGVSYSIYLVHFVLYIYESSAIRLLRAASGSPDALTDGAVIWDGAPWAGDLIIAANVVVVVGLSVFAYRFIEEPGRRFARAWAKRWEQRRLAIAPADQAQTAPRGPLPA